MSDPPQSPNRPGMLRATAPSTRAAPAAVPATATALTAPAAGGDVHYYFPVYIEVVERAPVDADALTNATLERLLGGLRNEGG